MAEERENLWGEGEKVETEKKGHLLAVMGGGRGGLFLNGGREGSFSKYPKVKMSIRHERAQKDPIQKLEYRNEHEIRNSFDKISVFFFK